FVVVDTHDVHVLSLNFCNCEKSQGYIQQLLRISWYPATSSRPRTAATFRVLEHFHLLSLESKVSAYEYYNTLARLVDNTG
ncbi:hypothetical protein PAXINDRAFT_62764, partial [Paxillus involutus ATCC 200175]